MEENITYTSKRVDEVYVLVSSEPSAEGEGPVYYHLWAGQVKNIRDDQHIMDSIIKSKECKSTWYIKERSAYFIDLDDDIFNGPYNEYVRSIVKYKGKRAYK